MPMTPQTEAAIPQTPLHDPDKRLTASQAHLENEEDPRIPDDAPVALSNLPVEAQVRDADTRSADRPRANAARELTAAQMAVERPGMSSKGAGE